MLTLALLAVAALFVLLFGVRVGGARRALWMRHAGAIALGAAAMYAVMRAQFYVAAGLALAAFALWFWTERPAARTSTGASSGGAMSEMEARTVLGVGPNATADEIRAAYRERMKRAHPDRGGSTQAAARLNAARATLLRR